MNQDDKRTVSSVNSGPTEIITATLSSQCSNQSKEVFFRCVPKIVRKPKWWGTQSSIKYDPFYEAKAAAIQYLLFLHSDAQAKERAESRANMQHIEKPDVFRRVTRRFSLLPPLDPELQRYAREIELQMTRRGLLGTFEYFIEHSRAKPKSAK